MAFPHTAVHVIAQPLTCTHFCAQADIALLTEEAHSCIRRFVDLLPSALKQLTYQPILFDFRIWSKCQFSLCIGQFGFCFGRFFSVRISY